MQQKTILILWDCSHIWGLMALRAMRSLGVRCRLVKAIEIAQSACLGKHSAADKNILLVPGGNARQKALSLGSSGFEAIRSWVASGGLYIGFCGGAGLALNEGEQALKICPLHREVFEKRFYHLLSGHVTASINDGREIALPIWWPGRFAKQEIKADIRILARYLTPCADLWLADLPLEDIPRDLLNNWAKSRNLDPNFGFPANQPLAISGKYGKGRYILSYAHPETPASPEANLWLVELLKEYGGMDAKNSVVPQWETFEPRPVRSKSAGAALHKISSAHSRMLELCEIALAHGLLFKRMDWLMGWQSGFSGMPCNNLLAALAYCLEFAPENCPVKLHAGFEPLFDKFMQKATSWIWQRKLDFTLNNIQAFSLPSSLAREQINIFGHPMSGGGLVEKLLNLLEEYIWHRDRFEL